jgi:hypothetical protein
MDTSEGFAGEGREGDGLGGGIGRGIGCAGGGRGIVEASGDPLEKLVAQVRKTLDQTLDERMDRFSGAYSEVILNQVLTRVKESQRRGAWLLRAGRWVSALVATLWNSRALRMLVP